MKVIFIHYANEYNENVSFIKLYIYFFILFILLLTRNHKVIRNTKIII